MRIAVKSLSFEEEKTVKLYMLPSVVICIIVQRFFIFAKLLQKDPLSEIASR